MKWGREGRRKLGADNFHYCTSLFFMYLHKAKGSVSVCECVVVQLQPQNEATVIANHVKAALPVPDKRTNWIAARQFHLRASLRFMSDSHLDIEWAWTGRQGSPTPTQLKEPGVMTSARITPVSHFNCPSPIPPSPLLSCPRSLCGALKIANKQNKTVINRKVVSEAAYEIIRSRPSEIQ